MYREAIKAKVASATGIGIAEQRLLWGSYELLVSLEELSWLMRHE